MPSDLPKQADSISAAVGFLRAHGVNVTAGKLKTAKAAGCKAFRGTRVYLHEYLEWASANAERDAAERGDDASMMSKEELQCMKLWTEIQRNQFRLAAEQRQFIPVAELRDQCARAVSEFRAKLAQLKGDAPQWAGMEPAAIQKRVADVERNILSGLETAFNQMAK